MKGFEQRVLERMPSPEEERAVLGRVWNQVERAGGQIPDDVVRSVQRRQPPRHQRAWAFLPKAAAAVLVLGAAIGTAIVWPSGVRVYAAGADGLQVTLSDDSRVEMRAHSEMTVARESDGIQIDLKTGDIIVTAARQRDRHLSVRTKDMTVALSAIAQSAKVDGDGTVFLVNAGQQGSRVGVIEGEVRVREGDRETRLRPGEQVATSPTIAPRLLADDITWSRNADFHRAMLQSFSRGIAQSSSPLTPVVPAGERQQGTGPASPAGVEFEEASIRTCDPTNIPRPPAGARGGGPSSFYMTPGRFYGLCMSLVTLTRLAYGYDMPDDQRSPIAPERPARGMRTDAVYAFGPGDGRRVRGGPDWVRSELYTIEAVAAGPADAQTMSRPMLRALLARRFGLKVRIETEQIPAFELTVAPGGHKMKETTCPAQSPLVGGGRVGAVPESRGMTVGDLAGGSLLARDAIRRGESPPTTSCGVGSALVNGPNVLRVFVGFAVPPFDPIVNAPIVNRTGIPATARFDFVLEYLPDDSLGRPGQISPNGGFQIASDPGAVPPAPGFFTALEEQLGLRLTPARAPYEFVVIDRVERPAPN